MTGTCLGSCNEAVGEGIFLLVSPRGVLTGAWRVLHHRERERESVRKKRRGEGSVLLSVLSFGWVCPIQLPNQRSKWQGEREGGRGGSRAQTHRLGRVYLAAGLGSMWGEEPRLDIDR